MPALRRFGSYLTRCQRQVHVSYLCRGCQLFWLGKLRIKIKCAYQHVYRLTIFRRDSHTNFRLPVALTPQAYIARLQIGISVYKGHNADNENVNVASEIMGNARLSYFCAHA